MSERAPIPNIPPLSSIADPNVRAVLQALVNGWQVRNGAVGDGEERFLTLRDLKDGVSLVSGGGSGGGGLQAGRSAGGAVAAVLRGLSDSIQQSRLWRLLGERIERIETPEWFRGRFGAEIMTEQVKNQNSNSALARQVTTAVAAIGNKLAIARQELEAVSDQAGATASAVTTLQTQVGNTTALAQEALTLAHSVDGAIDGAWTVKFDIDGYVTGAGLGVEGKGGAVSSVFMVRADRFVIGTPESANIPDYIPFIVQTTPTVVDGITIPAGVYMDTVFIKTASIDTLKLAGESVMIIRPYKVTSVPAAGYAGNNVPMTFDVGGSTIVLLFSAFLPGSGVYSRVDLYVNGALGAQTVLPHGDHYQAFHWSASGFPAGTYQLRIEVHCTTVNYPAGTNPSDLGFTYMGNMR